MEWILVALAAALLFWAMSLVVVSFDMDDWRTVWAQRVLAIILITGAVGLING